VCFGTRGVVLCKSRDVEIRMLSVCIIREEKLKGGVGGNKGYIYSSSGDFLVQCSTCEFCCLKNTKRPSLHLAELPGTS